MASNSITIEMLGLTELLANVAKLDKRIIKLVSMELEAACLTVVRDAKRAAPKDVGRLTQLISYVKHSDLDFEIVSAANYSAYMEFGTGAYASVPTGWDKFAALYQGVSINTGGKRLKEAIYEWAKRKGIDEKWWYWIYKKIQTTGIKPHPFFIPALVEFVKVEARIQKILNKPLL